MQVFLSWSGHRSRKLAQALHTWLKTVVQAAEPWMSVRDIDAGERWSSEIASGLHECNFGIICLTPENIAAPWLLFEAGALAKSVDKARVVPVLLGISPRDVPFPLAQFQSVQADRDGLLSLVSSLNASLGDSRLAGEILADAFDGSWSRIAIAIEGILNSTQPPPLDARRTDRDLLEEVLESVRVLRRARDGGSDPYREDPGAAAAEKDWEDHFTRGVDMANRRGAAESQLAALREYNEAIALLPHDVDRDRRARLFSNRGAILKRLGRLDEAMNDLQIAEANAQERYEFDDVRYNKACILAMTGHLAEALEVIQE